MEFVAYKNPKDIHQLPILKNFSCCKKLNIAQTEANNSNGSDTPSTTKISYTEDIMRKKNNVELKEICRENNLRIDGKRRI